MRKDVIVLGAGIVGTCTALQLTRAGASVALVDRRAPGEETSYGNSGVIGGPSVYPIAVPRSLWKLARIALKRTPQVSYHFGALAAAAPWLVACYRNSGAERLERTARTMHRLLAPALREHETLMEETAAKLLLRRTGWLSGYRQPSSFEAIRPALELAAELGRPFRVLEGEQTRELEPNMRPLFASAVLSEDIASISDPLALTRAYAKGFQERGGLAATGDAKSLRREGGGWVVEAGEDRLRAAEVVVALGPWCPDVLEPLGVRLPMICQRGYHRHFQAPEPAFLTRPVLDADGGYVLAPMRQGIRLTTGIEFARRDAGPTPDQLRQVTPTARRLLALGDPVERDAWVGCRPCLPDSMPVIGPVPTLPGLWIASGHGHFGLTLGPVTGRMIAEMMLGQETFADAAPFSVGRFS